jgi:N-acetyl-beta-hexosaminidase
MKPILFVCLLLSFGFSTAQSIIPAPIKMETKAGVFQVSSQTSVVVSKDKDAQKAAEYFVNQFRQASGISLTVTETSASGIILQLNTKENLALGKEGYTLDVTESKITVQANTGAGLFYGVQTLLQLFPKKLKAKP